MHTKHVVSAPAAPALAAAADATPPATSAVVATAAPAAAATGGGLAPAAAAACSASWRFCKCAAYCILTISWVSTRWFPAPGRFIYGFLPCCINMDLICSTADAVVSVAHVISTSAISRTGYRKRTPITRSGLTQPFAISETLSDMVLVEMIAVGGQCKLASRITPLFTSITSTIASEMKSAFSTAAFMSVVKLIRECARSASSSLRYPPATRSLYSS
mmetsp:Transcript_21332/g.55685  ORF Transcript_21332/g.55685 Transcript_21332/m.55685 type:complete len:218 (+) Transcript_21332:268-921(+)